MNQQIIYTALPNGIQTTGSGGPSLRISVLISPRLMNGPDPGTLAGWDFQHWPQLLANIRFAVRFVDASAETLQARRDPNSAPADEALWESLFPASTYVRPYVFDDHSNNFILSHPVANVLAFVQNQYSTLAASQTGPGLPSISATVHAINPGTTDQAGVLTKVSEDELSKSLLSEKQYVVGRLGQRAFAPQPPMSNVYADFNKLRYFHYRPKDAYKNLPPAGQAKLDFHDGVASLARYPHLMRRLGLVVDLLVPFDPRLPMNSSTSRLQISPTYGTAPVVSTQSILPQSYFTLTSTDFVATPQGSGIRNGMLNLDEVRSDVAVPAYALVEVDVDGAGLKLQNFAGSLDRMRDPRLSSTTATPQNVAPPALRTGGLSLVRTGRAIDLNATLKRATANNANAMANTNPTLHAEDLVRGYRVDIFDEGVGRWYSLCRRIGSYTFGTSKPFTIEDEGYVSLGATQDPTTPAFDGTPPDYYLHESLFRWKGWSLSAPLPGNTLSSTDQPSVPNNQPAELKLQADFRAKGRSLPRLRFGRRYRMRVRTVDLAGNSLPYNIPNNDHTAPSKGSPAFVYRRYEPVPAPAIVRHDDDTNVNGEAVNRMVVRSDIGGQVGAPYINFLRSLGYNQFVETSQRHIVPPQIPVQMAETHGMFDVASGPSVLDHAAYDNISSTHIGFADGSVRSLDNGLPDLITADQATLPYLPDPLARGAAIFGLPGSAAGTSFQQPYGGTAWPFLQPFRLQVVGVPDGQTSQVVGFSGGVLRIALAQGDRLDLLISSYMLERDLDLMGMWNWIQQYAAANPGINMDALTRLALFGGLWSLTPFHEVQMVHAVQRPLIRPAWATLQAVKQYTGVTYALLENVNLAMNSVPVQMPISGKSTMKVDIMATWSQRVDDPTSVTSSHTANGFDTVKGSAHVCEIPVAVADTGVDFTIFPPDASPVNERRHEFGDTKYRLVNYTAVATTRFREYFPMTDAQVTSGASPPYTVTSDVATIDVPNSARPDAPNLLYVIPAFEWSTTPSSGQVQVQRLGGRVRVYMKPPWFSSGDGELLGVVLMPAGSPPASAEARPRGAARLMARGRGLFGDQQVAVIGDPLKPLVTQWGMDPLWNAAALQNFPAVSNFPLAIAPPSGYAVNGFSLDELPGHVFDVAGHAVQWDADRKLWYADIEFNFGKAYYPFVRLALARYQPRSIYGAYLSRVFLADLVQLAPNRVATFGYSSSSKFVSVSVSGPAFVDKTRQQNLIDVIAEQQQPGVQGELAWVPVPNGVFPLGQTNFGADTIWSGTVTLPRPPGSGQFRLLVKEYEQFYHTDDTSGANSIVRRLVYASTVTL